MTATRCIDSCETAAYSWRSTTSTECCWWSGSALILPSLSHSDAPGSGCGIGGWLGGGSPSIRSVGLASVYDVEGDSKWREPDGTPMARRGAWQGSARARELREIGRASCRERGEISVGAVS